MGVKERLRAYIKTLNISEREFCRRIGVSVSYVNSIRKSIQPEKLKAITEAFPNLNPVWLMTGDGSMLEETPKEEVVTNNSNSTVAGTNTTPINKEVEGLIELQKGYQELLRAKDEQISRLISVLEKLTNK